MNMTACETYGHAYASDGSHCVDCQEVFGDYIAINESLVR